ncbi:MAG: LysR family transcriptional regulator [Mesorhizobium amorphae]|nr:MAG: LysR family transcriptional regulator [Mesorhizobium amorphae]
MLRMGLDDLTAFALIARERSFTRAAAMLGVSQSSLSRSMRGLETRLGVRLIARTTRSVAPTEAGERLLRGLQPALDAIETELSVLGSVREKPSGTLRITAVRHAFETILRPALPRFLAEHPDIRVEVSLDDGFTDIVAERFDAGLRFGGLIEKDMIAVRVGPDVETAVVGSPGYLSRRGTPEDPRALLDHACVNYRMASSGRIFPWRFLAEGGPLDIRVEGSLTVNDGQAMLSAALDGVGLAYTFVDEVRDDLAAGRLVRVLAKHAFRFPGYHLFHPSRRLVPPALRALVDALKAAPLAR